MEEYNFIVTGRRHRIRLPKHEKGAPFLIEVDGKTSQLELKNEEFRYGSPFTIKIAGRSHRVELNKVNRNTQFSIKINRKAYTVQYETTRILPSPTLKPPFPMLERKPYTKNVSEKGVVTAPMPGKVVLLKVKIGDAVHVGEPLCVLEAMKMENEITSPISGVVTEVKVSEGATVNIGETMVVVSET